MNQQEPTVTFFDLALKAGKAAGYVKGLVVGFLFGICIGAGVATILLWCLT